MKRWTLRILVGLSLGVVTTVAVAWGLAWLFCESPPSSRWATSARGVEGDPSEANIGFVLQARLRNESHLPKGMKPDFTWVEGNQSSLADVVRVTSVVGNEYSSVSTSFQSGWPMRALITSTGDVYTREANGTVITNAWSYGDLVEVETIWIPSVPILPGFLINTLFYAAIWFGLFLGLGRTRRFIRAKRGRCPKCGYDLRGEFGDGCSECGWGRKDRTRER